MRRVIFCPVCGAEADAGARRCPRCDAPFESEPEVRLRPRRERRPPWLAILVTIAALAATATLLFVLLA